MDARRRGAGPVLAAVVAAEQVDAEHEDPLIVGRIDADLAEVEGARTEVVELLPGLAAVIGADEAAVVAQVFALYPGHAAVYGLVEAALFVRSPEVAQGGDVDDVRILRMDGDGADVVRIGQAHVAPGFAGVGGLVDAVAPGDAV